VSVLQRLRKPWKGVVIDVGSLQTSAEKSTVIAAILGHFWMHRYDKEPVLIVIDEAHNVCPQIPPDELTRICTDYVVNIAGEGRKFGLFLLVASQRPAKVHANVVSQCDNLILMRMQSGTDLTYITDTFGQLAPTLATQAATFSQGEALIVGKLAPSPLFAKFDGRLTKEGGADVDIDWGPEKPS